MDTLNRRDIDIGPGSCQIAHSQGRMIARNLCSELLLVLYAEKCKLGTMLRFYDDPTQIAFAETALGLFLGELPTLGIKKPSLCVHAIGGVTGFSRCFTSINKLLRMENIALAGTDLAINQSRSVWLVLSSGHLIVRAAVDATGPIRVRRPNRLAS